MPETETIREEITTLPTWPAVLRHHYASGGMSVIGYCCELTHAVTGTEFRSREYPTYDEAIEAMRAALDMHRKG
ncbi:MAG: hypothetical protein WC455_14620 [Dehalococcoidia bacterium]|jgi:hypothetical protein